MTSEKRQHLRLELIPLGFVKFRTAPDQRVLNLFNISRSGVGLQFENGGLAYEKGKTILGSLLHGTEELVVELKVVRISGSIIGCEFIDPASVSKTIEKWLAIEFSAAKLEAVNPKVLKEEKEGQPHFYRGLGAELFFVENDQQLVRFEMAFFGNFVEGGAGCQLRWGVLDEDEKTGPRMKGSTIVRYAKKSREEILELAKRFISSIRKLNPAHKKLFEAVLK